LNPSLNTKPVLRDGLFLLALRIIRFKNILIFWHGWNVEFASHLTKRPIFRMLFVMLFGSASRTLVLSSTHKEELVNIGFEDRRVLVTTTAFDRLSLKTPLAAKTSQGLTLLFLSRLIKEKGIYLLLDAFSLLANQFPELTLIIAGDGPERNATLNWIQRRSLEHRVKLTGYLDGREKADTMMKSDIFVLPTYHGEGCPVALIEAMAMGLAIIATPVGGIGDIVETGVNGILLSNLTSKNISKEIAYLIENPDIRRQLQRAAKDKAWRHFEGAIVAHKLQRTYFQIINS
jgi:glycosyltransferase involved in cell wall biosynthesis